MKKNSAVMSNVEDYTKWIRCLLNKSAPLSKETHKDIQTPRFIDDRLPTFGMSDVSLVDKHLSRQQGSLPFRIYSHAWRPGMVVTRAELWRSHLCKLPWSNSRVCDEETRGGQAKHCTERSIQPNRAVSQSRDFVYKLN